MKFRYKVLASGTKLTLGKNKESNEALVRDFMGKENKMLHTALPGSPFCVIETLKPSKKEIYESGVICAKLSQDWRDNKRDVVVNVFTGKNVYKEKSMPIGTFGVKKQKKIVIKKEDILKLKDN